MWKDITREGAINEEEYAPITSPQIRLIAKSFISPDPNIERGTIANSVVSVVMAVLVKDCLTERETISYTSAPLLFLIFSLTLSKMTIVLLREYPMIVSTAAMVVPETSRRRITTNESIINTSCIRAMIDDRAYESLNLIDM